jgi:hypothetical protein
MFIVMCQCETILGNNSERTEAILYQMWSQQIAALIYGLPPEMCVCIPV